MKLPVSLLGLILLVSCQQGVNNVEISYQPWSKEKAIAWYDSLGWVAGCNFIPSTAINQLEMWQEHSYDPETIDRELEWAADLGFNIVRVYLHNLPWQEDSAGFITRMENFLGITEKHEIGVMFVFFDDCWYGNAELGDQPSPDSGLHNSYWLQCPRYAEVMDESAHAGLERYVKHIMEHFSNDKRVVVWDLYNEPANNHFPNQVMPLLKKVFHWAREVAPSQPVTVGVWKTDIHYTELNDYQLENSDIITFHNYGSYESIKKLIENYQSYGRPVICTEYLARGMGNLFHTHLPLMKKENVGAINWGLVFGKTQTVYPWNTPLGTPVPKIWHHDIFWPDGTPYSDEEVKLIREVTGKE